MISQTCIIGDVDTCGDGPDFINEDIVTARKPHVCCECHGTINPGDKYEHVRGKWEGDFSTFKTCIPCRTIRNHYFHSFGYGELWNDIIQYVCDSTPWNEKPEYEYMLPESLKNKGR